MEPDLVVGGGVAGLVIARRLALAGRPVVLLEAGDRLGGQLARQEVAGVALDAAAESFATRGGTVAALLDELGLGDEVVLPNSAPAWLHRADDSSVPLPATGLLGIPGDPSAADVRRAIGDRAARRALLDARLPAWVGARSKSLGGLVRLRMGRGVLTGLVAPVVRGVHSRDPRELPVEVASPRLREELRERGSLTAAVLALRAAAPAGSQVAGLRGGMHRLAEALVAELERLGVEVELSTQAETIESDSVLLAGGGRRRGRVILAAPDPALAAAGAAAGRRVTLVTLVAEAPAWDGAPRGTGMLIAAGARDVAARALTHLSAKWEWVAEALPGRHAVRLSYDGEPENAIVQAIEDAELLLGAHADRIVDASTVSWLRPGGGSAAAREDGIPAAGETVAGTGLASIVAQAERVAGELLEG